MSSRESILNAVKANQPENQALPDKEQLGYANNTTDQAKLKEKFITTLTNIGGKAEMVKNINEARIYIQNLTNQGKRNVTATHILNDMLEPVNPNLADAQSFENVNYAVIQAGLAVAENGAIWVIENDLKVRALPFICQHLVAIINTNAIVPDMHCAYEQIGDQNYGFAAFIAGPSKTADIEQSLVLGAHGPRSMTVLVVGE